MSNFLLNNPLSRFIRTIVGPAAIMAAGMIGAGAVATRLLAGTWFSFDLLWVALYVIPMVIYTLDSASRVGIMSGGRGMLDMIKTEIFPALAWIIFVPQFLLNIIVNISQMSVMTEAVYGVFGIDLPPAGAVTPLKIIIVLVLITLVVYACVIGSFKKFAEDLLNSWQLPVRLFQRQFSFPTDISRAMLIIQRVI